MTVILTRHPSAALALALLAQEREQQRAGDPVDEVCKQPEPAEPLPPGLNRKQRRAMCKQMRGKP